LLAARTTPPGLVGQTSVPQRPIPPSAWSFRGKILIARSAVRFAINKTPAISPLGPRGQRRPGTSQCSGVERSLWSWGRRRLLSPNRPGRPLDRLEAARCNELQTNAPRVLLLRTVCWSGMALPWACGRRDRTSWFLQVSMTAPASMPPANRWPAFGAFGMQPTKVPSEDGLLWRPRRARVDGWRLATWPVWTYGRRASTPRRGAQGPSCLASTGLRAASRICSLQLRTARRRTSLLGTAAVAARGPAAGKGLCAGPLILGPQAGHGRHAGHCHEARPRALS